MGTRSSGNSRVFRTQETRTSNVASVYCRGCLNFSKRPDCVIWYSKLSSTNYRECPWFQCDMIQRIATTWNSETTTASSNTSSSTSNYGEELPSIDNTTTLTPFFLNAHRLESLSLSTTWRWMRLSHFNHDAKKKSFYVDGHERDNVVANRQTSCKRYFTDDMLYCKRWVVQLSVE